KSDPAIDCRRAIEQNPTDPHLHPTAAKRPTVPRHQTHRTLDLPTIYPLLPTCRLLPAPLVLQQLPQRWRWLLQIDAYTGRPFGAARKQDSQWHTDCPHSTSSLQLDRAVSVGPASRRRRLHKLGLRTCIDGMQYYHREYRRVFGLPSGRRGNTF
ncbi:hypothetical protein PoMZ_12393, partial [Pyricularia oryzae]